MLVYLIPDTWNGFRRQLRYAHSIDSAELYDLFFSMLHGSKDVPHVRQAFRWWARTPLKLKSKSDTTLRLDLINMFSFTSPDSISGNRIHSLLPRTTSQKIMVSQLSRDFSVHMVESLENFRNISRPARKKSLASLKDHAGIIVPSIITTLSSCSP